MAALAGYQWQRDKDGLRVWEHRGNIAVAGVGHSPDDRRWDGVSFGTPGQLIHGWRVVA